MSPAVKSTMAVNSGQTKPAKLRSHPKAAEGLCLTVVDSALEAGMSTDPQRVDGAFTSCLIGLPRWCVVRRPAYGRK